jgi:uncharacterized membrane protein YfcA
MTPLSLAALAALIFAAALFYSAVGNAGASGYLAVMALLGVTSAAMKPTALVLNILVATVATLKFHHAGLFAWSRLLPFTVTSVPCSFIGGYIILSSNAYKIAVGLILLFAAFMLLRHAQATVDKAVAKHIPLWAALVSGAVIGLLAGLTGTGGGIFLSPLLIFMGWAETRQALGLSAAFILVNSIAGLLGNVSSVGALPGSILVLAPAAVAGGYIGAEYGSRRLAGANLRRLLAVVLIIAGLKLIFT